MRGEAKNDLERLDDVLIEKLEYWVCCGVCDVDSTHTGNRNLAVAKARSEGFIGHNGDAFCAKCKPKGE